MITVKEIETNKQIKNYFYDDNILVAIEEGGEVIFVKNDLSEEKRKAIKEMI